MKKMAVLVTCEHAGNRIPRRWQPLISIPQDVLQSHRGIDIGAKSLAKDISKILAVPLHIYEKTRLLIELNRSLHHPKLFSEYSKALSPDQKASLIDTLYVPYRDGVEQAIHRLVKERKRVLHLSIHSFTPIWNGEERTADIGLLYDPQRSFERRICTELKSHFQSDFRTRMNYPYLGKADGFTRYLRTLFRDADYAGIELEVNQQLLIEQPKATSKTICQRLAACLKGNSL
ncbi:MAG: N-formylglutamate amidohydrolase [Chlamydiia bacterium]|nr:N-formylglutamate amidohydrolase [Chlamydiia bacterium]